MRRPGARISDRPSAPGAETLQLWRSRRSVTPLASALMRRTADGIPDTTEFDVPDAGAALPSGSVVGCARPVGCAGEARGVALPIGVAGPEAGIALPGEGVGAGGGRGPGA